MIENARAAAAHQEWLSRQLELERMDAEQWRLWNSPGAEELRQKKALERLHEIPPEHLGIPHSGGIARNIR
jgi:hypothetical protein